MTSRRLVYNLGVENIHLLSGEELSFATNYVVMLNGNVLGITKTFVCVRGYGGICVGVRGHLCWGTRVFVLGYEGSSVGVQG